MQSSLAETIDKIMSEGALGMTEIAKLSGVFRSGKLTHPATITRWCQDGVTLPNGKKLRLEHYRQCGRLISSKQALIRFLEAQQDQAATASMNAPRSASARSKASKKAESELSAMGV